MISLHMQDGQGGPGLEHARPIPARACRVKYGGKIRECKPANASTLTLIKQTFEAAGVRFKEYGGIVPPKKI
jgi:hypothetical protein